MISNLYTALEKIRKGKNLEKNNRKILEKIKFKLNLNFFFLRF